jgi:hypothetical protein
MLRARRTAALAISFALVFPAAALADSAGDQQYQDPLGNTPAKPKTPKPTTTTPTQTPSASPAPATSTVPSSAAKPAAAQSSGTLPRTGFPIGPVIALGAALIGAGFLIRRLT